MAATTSIPMTTTFTILLTILLTISPAPLPAAPADLADLLRRAAAEAEAMETELVALRQERDQARREPPAFSVGPAGLVAPATVHVHALRLLGEAPHLAEVTWDFGDPGSAYDVLPGFNAAHVYDQPGTYTIHCTVARPGEAPETHETSVTIRADARQVIFVAADGDDRADGRTPTSPLRSLDEAARRVRDYEKIVLRRGDAFPLLRAMVVTRRDVALGHWGDSAAPLPIVRWAGGRGGGALVEARGADLRIDGVRFETPFDAAGGRDGVPSVVRGPGQNLTLRDVEAANVADLVNGGGGFVGVLVQGCRIAGPTDLFNYFVYAGGRNYVVLGNSVANSTREHVVRAVDAQFVLCYDNDFTNLDRRDVDPADDAKATFNIQKGRLAWVEKNNSRGAWGVGPLGERDGLSDPSARWEYAVFKHNAGDTTLSAEHGAGHVRFDANLLRVRNNPAFRIEGFNRAYNRGNRDVHVVNNVAVNTGTRGNFLRVQGWAEEVVLAGNVYVAPNLRPGSHATGAVQVNHESLDGFARIEGNVWPDAAGRGNNWAQGGLFYVGIWDDQAGYKTPDWWRGRPVVSGDVVKDVTEEEALRRVPEVPRHEARP